MSEVEGYCVCDGASTAALDCGVSAHRAKARELRYGPASGSSVPEAARAAEGHDARCFQSTNTADELVAKGLSPDQCDCRTLRMIDAAQCPNACGPGFACSDCPPLPPTRDQLMARVDSLAANNEALAADLERAQSEAAALVAAAVAEERATTGRRIEAIIDDIEQYAPFRVDSDTVIAQFRAALASPGEGE